MRIEPIHCLAGIILNHKAFIVLNLNARMINEVIFDQEQNVILPVGVTMYLNKVLKQQKPQLFVNEEEYGVLLCLIAFRLKCFLNVQKIKLLHYRRMNQLFGFL